MTNYFMQFQVLGEVAGFLQLKGPERRLLVDISTEVRNPYNPHTRPYESRTCFTITQANLIEAFLEKLAVGDTIEATGTFAQTNYVPHKTSYIDTTFQMLDFRKIYQGIGLLELNGHVFEPAPGSLVH